MRAETKKVLQHFVYQGALTADLKPKKHALTLPAVLRAGEEEPRILEVLPGLILLGKAGLYNLNRDLENIPDLEKLVKALEKNRSIYIYDFRGVPVGDIQKQYKILSKIYDRKEKQKKSRSLNIRISSLELEKLEALSKKRKLPASQVLRDLINENSG